MEYIMIGACLALVEEITKSINLEQKQKVNNNRERDLALSMAECKDLYGTITCTKSTLSSLATLPSLSSSLTPPSSPPPRLSSSPSSSPSSSSPSSSPSSSSSSPLSSECTLQTCISGIQHNLNTLHKIITQHDPNNKNKFKAFNAKRLKMFQLDFALRQKVDQISALFLNDKVYSLISDSEGREFWDNCFGQTLFVTWELFLQNFENYQNLSIKQSDLLKKTLDFAEDNFVSLYEFSLFLKWFGPFSGCYTRFQEAFDSGILCGFVPGMEANMLLDGKPPGYPI
eukprot:Phypoly_transcript_04206.p1 GENE.Phypoly_transcript_04206~~Phypoly_transcript_04206.p1  ORF type:complete len:320 (+),score=61.09 Phypoly_transcript_04206:107-961(+)